MTYEFKLPDIGEGVVEGEVVAGWSRRATSVREDQPLVEIMTDKATVEIPSPRAGRSRKLHVRRGPDLPGRQGPGRRSRPTRRRRGPRRRRAAPRLRGNGRSPPGSRRQRPRSGPRAARDERERRERRACARASWRRRRRASWRASSASTSAQVVGTGRAGRITSDDVRDRGTGRVASSAVARRPARTRGGAHQRPRDAATRASRSAGVRRQHRRAHGALEAHRRALHLRRGDRLHRPGRAARQAPTRGWRRATSSSVVPAVHREGDGRRPWRSSRS